MTGIPLLIVFALAIVLMIVAISKFRIHPFLSLMGTSLLLAIVVGLPLGKIPGIIGAGFSGTFASIGIVIILGALIGLILERTGAAIRLADVVIRCVGEKHPQLAIMLMGWIVSIPVFCDSGFVILNPIRKALCQKLKTASPIGMAVALSAGLYTSHVFIPPTPGPIAAAGSLGLADNLAAVILVGVIASVPALIAAYLFSLYIGKNIYRPRRPTPPPIRRRRPRRMKSSWRNTVRCQAPRPRLRRSSCPSCSWRLALWSV